MIKQCDFLVWCGKWFGGDSDESYLARAVQDLPTTTPTTVQSPVAYGLFAKTEDGEFVLQHPVRFTEEDAKADRAMYEKSVMIQIRPLYC